MSTNRYAKRLGLLAGLTMILGVVALVVGFTADFDNAGAFISGGITLIAAGLVAQAAWYLGSWWNEVSAQHTRAIVSWLKDDDDEMEGE